MEVVIMDDGKRVDIEELTELGAYMALTDAQDLISNLEDYMRENEW